MSPCGSMNTPFTVAGGMNADDRACALVALDPDGMTAMTAEAVFAAD